ncbi:MAG: hypothetical protein ACOCWC_05320 [Bacteroidota bacterium]
MKTIKKKFKTASLFNYFIILLSLVFIATSCSKDDDEGGAATIKFKATYDSAKMLSDTDAIVEGVVVESFKINIQEIEFEFNDEDPLFENDSIATDYELEGPFEIDLMQDGNALETTLVNNVDLPAAAYEEIEFEFTKSDNSISEMYDKSILVKGTINDLPFIFWADEDFELEIEFDEGIVLDQLEDILIVVSFDIASLFNPTTGVDVTGAVDGNGNGIIEIYPDDPDGNSDLSDLIWETLEDMIDAFEDSYDD